MNFDIIYIIFLLMIFMFLAYRQRKNINNIKNINETNYEILVFPKIVKFIGYICLVTLIITLVQDVPSLKQNEILPIIIFSLLVIIVALYLILLVNVKKILYNNYSIIEKSFFGVETELKWDEITKIKLNRFVGEMILYKGEQKIKVSTLYIGYEHFYDLVKSKRLL